MDNFDVQNKKPEIHSRYFYGNKISDYGLEHNRVDYGTLARAFDNVMNNDIWNKAYDWEPVNGYIDGDEEIFQTFIISNTGVDILSYWTDEIVYYSESLNMYVWGVTHWGTSWDYVLTDIEVKLND